MTMSPFEVERREFGRSVMGYRQREVDAFVDEIRQTLTGLWQERSELREEVERLSERLTRFSAMEEQLKNTLLLAQDSADKSTEQARREAELVLTEAGQKARDIVHQAHEDKSRIERSLSSLRAIEQETRQRFRSLAEAVIANLDESELAAEHSALTLRAAVEEAESAAKRSTEATEAGMKTFTDHAQPTVDVDAPVAAVEHATDVEFEPASFEPRD